MNDFLKKRKERNTSKKKKKKKKERKKQKPLHQKKKQTPKPKPSEDVSEASSWCAWVPSSAKFRYCTFITDLIPWVQRWLRGNESAANVGDSGDQSVSIPGLERSPEGGNGNPHQYASLKNPMVRGALRATVHGLAELDAAEHTYTY